MDRLVVNYVGREKRYALLKENKIEKLVIQQPEQQTSVGNIYLGVVTKVLPGMNAVFVDIGEEKNGYLHRDKLASFVTSTEASKASKGISSFAHQGEKILVQVEKDATGNKGPRLSGIIEFNGSSVVYMPNGAYIAVSKKIQSDTVREAWRQFGHEQKREHEGFVFRTSCENQTPDEIMNEITELRHEYEEIIQMSKTMKKAGILLERNTFIEEILEVMSKMDTGEAIVDQLDLKNQITKHNNREDVTVQFYQKKEDLFSSLGLNLELEKALKKIVWLSNGAYLIFDETEALTVVDVNTGKFSGKSDLRDTVVKTNELAAEEIARQIRLRDLAGIILIDFIDMKENEDRQRVQRRMESALYKDDRRTRVVGFTSLEILQLTRKKTKNSISETLTTKCSVCEGTGRVMSPETIAFQLERELWEYRQGEYEAVLIETTAEVEHIFSGEQNIHLLRLQEILGMNIYFYIMNHSKPYYTILQLGNIKDIESRMNKG
ncbi:Rne/Rng family ribonuclease (plasmid) [Bacillus sp. 31A1R]|uniref:Rne/Rng family ribonuclease n=1 Tax=Robertmurraya mangrovi TaxID=3098077 RepID=A0ABU5IUJ7_9BACI|nr:Rne/Rng family ribonuclease [Bacillus sp. 31A1R]MDZ5470823.1 Rne/Rng family ribonuclease [Bacillus sp. 31A1R]